MVSSEGLSGSPPPLTMLVYGVTKPISMAGSTESDIRRSRDLEKFLVEAGLNESKEEAAKREEVLGRIQEIESDWVKHLSRLRRFEDRMVEYAIAVIFTFGSYQLGVHGPGTDIDTLCVGPSYVNLEEYFFFVLHNIMAEREEVTELQPVPDADVPVMKFSLMEYQSTFFMPASLIWLCLKIFTSLICQYCTMLMSLLFDVLMAAGLQIKF